MSDNPFSQIVNVIRDGNKAPVNYRFGNVTSLSPFTVDVSGTIQDESALLKNDLITSFAVGDRLFLIPIEDEQRYVIICKVVNT